MLATRVKTLYRLILLETVKQVIRYYALLRTNSIVFFCLLPLLCTICQYLFHGQSKIALKKARNRTCLITLRLSLRLIGNSRFRFCNRTQNKKKYFTFEKSVLRVDFNEEIQTRNSWISFLPFDWEIRKRICKTTFVNSGLFLLIMRACAGK